MFIRQIVFPAVEIRWVLFGSVLFGKLNAELSVTGYFITLFQRRIQPPPERRSTVKVGLSDASGALNAAGAPTATAWRSFATLLPRSTSRIAVGHFQGVLDTRVGAHGPHTLPFAKSWRLYGAVQ